MRGYKFFQLKAYFDKGMGILNYVKYLILLLGLDSILKGDIKTMLIIILGFGALCFIIGFIMYHYRFVDAETEIGNKYNPFVQEIRDKFGIPKNRKV